MIELYNMASMARDGNGGINYSVLLDVAKSNGLESYDDLLFLAGQIDIEIAKLRKN